jgi:RNA polymerase primary sigma factor
MLDMETTHMDNHDPDDPVAMYIREARDVKPLTKEEEAKLFRELGSLVRWGDLDEQREKVARRLIESQLMLVVGIAQRHSVSAVPMLELIQEGNIGLMSAVKSFAERPIGDFTAHATACIEDAIAKTLGKSNSGTV